MLRYLYCHQLFRKIRMMWMNDRHFVYWKLNAKEKFQRTMYMIPFVVILCFLTPFFMRENWVISDITLIVLLVWQLIDTYIKMKKIKLCMKGTYRVVNEINYLPERVFLFALDSFLTRSLADNKLRIEHLSLPRKLGNR